MLATTHDVRVSTDETVEFSMQSAFFGAPGAVVGNRGIAAARRRRP